MKNMRKIIALLTVAVMMLSFTGCSLLSPTYYTYKNGEIVIKDESGVGDEAALNIATWIGSAYLDAIVYGDSYSDITYMLIKKGKAYRYTSGASKSTAKGLLKAIKKYADEDVLDDYKYIYFVPTTKAGVTVTKYVCIGNDLDEPPEQEYYLSNPKPSKVSTDTMRTIIENSTGKKLK